MFGAQRVRPLLQASYEDVCPAHHDICMRALRGGCCSRPGQWRPQGRSRCTHWFGAPVSVQDQKFQPRISVLLFSSVDLPFSLSLFSTALAMSTVVYSGPYLLLVE